MTEPEKIAEQSQRHGSRYPSWDCPLIGLLLAYGAYVWHELQ